jgi:hypothetical protein
MYVALMTNKDFKHNSVSKFKIYNLQLTTWTKQVVLSGSKKNFEQTSDYMVQVISNNFICTSDFNYKFITQTSNYITRSINIHS